MKPDLQQKKNNLRRQIVERGVKQLLEEAQIPAHQHYKVIAALKQEIEKNGKDRQSFHQVLLKHAQDLNSYDSHVKEHTAIVNHLRTLSKGEKGDSGLQGRDGRQGVKGEDGRDGYNGKDGRHGRDGKDATAKELDTDKLYGQFITKIKKEQPFDMSNVKGAQGFIRDGVRYRFEELMHGGGSQTSSGLSIIAVTGTVNDSNLTFSAAFQPTLLNINGAFYQKTGGAITWSYAGGTITLSSPVGTGGQIFGV